MMPTYEDAVVIQLIKANYWTERDSDDRRVTPVSQIYSFFFGALTTQLRGGLFYEIKISTRHPNVTVTQTHVIEVIDGNKWHPKYN